MKSGKKRILYVVAAVIAIAAVAIAPSYLDRHKANVSADIVLYVKDSTSTLPEICSMFAGGLKNQNSFARVAKRNNLEGNIKTGRYLFGKGSSNIEIVRALKFGWETPFNLTLSGNIRGLEKLSSILGKKMLYDFLDTSSLPLHGKNSGQTRPTSSRSLSPIHIRSTGAILRKNLRNG